MLPTGAADDNAIGGPSCGNVELGFFYAHRRIPPDSSWEDDGCEEDGAAQGVWVVSASNHTHASGVRMLPVGTHTQVIRPVLRIVSSLLFIVPPFRSGADASKSSAWGADRTSARTIGWGVVSQALKTTGSRAQGHRLYAVLSGVGIGLARLEGTSGALIATQEKSPDTRRFWCGIYAHIVVLLLLRR
jgi:hypothetical protein